ncbi:hypothetical protein WDW89_02730 [Deltaproteobacteria bacterium TL4]
MSSSAQSQLKVPSEADLAYLESTALDDEIQVKNKPIKENQRYKLFMGPAGDRSKTLRSEETISSSNHLSSDSPPLENGSIEETSERLMALSEIPENIFNQAPLTSTLSEALTTSPQDTKPGQLRRRSHANLPIVEEDEMDEEPPWGKMVVILTLVLLAFLGVTGTGIYLGLVDSSVFSQLMGKPVHRFEFAGPLQGIRVKNIPSQRTLFVVNGTLINRFPTEDQIRWIQLKGIAFDLSRNVVESRIVYAGNTLSEEELATWGIQKVTDFYKYNNGRNNANFELKQDQEVPFQVVFFDSESVLKHTSAKIVSYSRQEEMIFVKLTEE